MTQPSRKFSQVVEFQTSNTAYSSHEFIWLYTRSIGLIVLHVCKCYKNFDTINQGAQPAILNPNKPDNRDRGLERVLRTIKSYVVLHKIS